MSFVKLTRFDGRPIYVNPDTILMVEPAPGEDRVGLRFAVLAPDTGYPYSEVVRGSLEDVVSALDAPVVDAAAASFAYAFGGLEPLRNRRPAVDGDRDF